MNPTGTSTDAEPDLEAPGQTRRRLAVIFSLLLVILLLAVVPPLINVSRFQRRIARSISASIGRPVHFDRLSLSVLPTLGFTLDNFVIQDDPAFSYEPLLRADEVHVTLRFSSLWRGHPEFSTISLSEPTSVNLVHLSDGRWNIESLLFQASHIPAAPTAQRHAGPAPRFPYIEATGARVNLKLDQDKTAFSLDQAEFAIWEPEPNQWRIRLAARPVRTDSAPAETGLIRAEGTLGASGVPAASLTATPINLHGDWTAAQLGGLSQFVSGSDAGLRGDLSAAFDIRGTLQQNSITADITLLNARRADFIPPAPLTLAARCVAHSTQTFHAFTGIACSWPPPDSDGIATLILAGDVPDVRTPASASVRVTLPAVPAATFFGWLSVATPHPPVGLAGPGTLSGELLWGTPQTSQTPAATWSGELEFSGGSIALSSGSPIPLGDVILQASQPAAAPAATSGHRHPARPVPPAQPLKPDSFDLLPVSLDLGGRTPATLTGHLDDSGYTLHLTGSVLPSRLVAVGQAVPQLGDGLDGCLPHTPTPQSPAVLPASFPHRGGSPAPADHTAAPAPETPIAVDLTATREWGGPQTWCPSQPPPAQDLSSHPARANPPQVAASK